MSRKKNQRRYSGKSRSLIARGLIDAQQQLAAHRGQVKREVALLMRLPLKDVYEIRFRKHQLWVLCKGADGGPCTQFFSYRRLPIWQRMVMQAVAKCNDLGEWGEMSEAIAWEYGHFPYAVEMMDAIDEALENRFCQLQAAEKM